jgi:hypothetical protein
MACLPCCTQAVPKAEADTPRTAAAVKGSGEDEDDEVLALPEVCISVREARPVHLMWKQVSE